MLCTSTSVLNGVTGGQGQAGIYLISDKAYFMTGKVMHVNGGSNFG